jgi:predicted outer membrane protein
MFVVRTRTALAVTAAWLICGATAAQAQLDPGLSPETPSPPAPATQLGPATAGLPVPAMPEGLLRPELENDLVRLLIQSNRGEMLLGRFAEQRTTDPQVKQFAQRMIRSHSKLIVQLQLLQTATVPWQGTSQILSDPAVQPAIGAQPVPRAAGEAENLWTDSRLVTIHHQVVQRRLALAETYLSTLQGTRFDEAYIGQQIGGHIEMLAMIETFQRFVSPRAGQVLGAAVESTQEHLAMAKNIERELSSAVARRQSGEKVTR